MTKRKHVVAYQVNSPWASQVFWLHWFLGRRIYRSVDFWRPTGWDDLNWRFFAALGGICLAWAVTAWSIWHYFKTRTVYLKVTPDELLSFQQSKFGMPDNEPRRISTSDLVSIESQDANWITFATKEGKPFHLFICRLFRRKRRLIWEILNELGFEEQSRDQTGFEFARPRFTILNVMAFTTVVAVLLAVYRASVMQLGLHPMASAVIFGCVMLMLSIAVVTFAAMWLGFTGSKKAEALVNSSGIVMAASVPAGVLVVGIYSIPTMFQQLVRLHAKEGLTPVISMLAIFLLAVWAVLWMLQYFYGVYRQQRLQQRSSTVEN